MEFSKIVKLQITIIFLFIAELTYSQGQSLASSSCDYAISFISELDPIEINRMHSWVINVKTKAGIPVEGATIRLEGGMPEHDHGLPTNPRMTAELGSGNYRIEGIRFHMGGTWEIKTTITIKENRDICTIPLEL
ncbi:MAG: auxin-binding protein [Rhodospirillaceae bacterium]|nr:auxin-binding protein [Rhodospirillaceae bacterium]|tara:strand:- start:546 stop:950 length:405 start_codon:yes stop_codon:yes gene_type:complete